MTRKQLRTLLTRLEDARLNQAWARANRPDDVPRTEADYTRLRALVESKIIEHMDALTAEKLQSEDK